MQNNEFESRDQAEFNMAVSYLYRLNNIIYVINEASLDLDFWKWFHGLMVLYREVSTELKGDINVLLDKDFPEDPKNEFAVVSKLVSDIEPLIGKFQRVGNNGINKELYTKLHILDIYLRQILKKSGLLIKIRQDPKFALG